MQVAPERAGRKRVFPRDTGLRVRHDGAMLRPFRVLWSPFAAAVVAWRRRSERAAISVLLARLATPVTALGVQAALRAALGDQAAALFYQLPGGAGLVSASGEAAGHPASGQAGPRVFTVSGHDGEVIVLLAVDPVRAAEPDRVELALTACRPALENARLQAVLQARLRDAEASRAEIVWAAVGERRRLARDLHDGAQQHLLGLLTNLLLARQQATRSGAVAAIDSAQGHLYAALGGLRSLSHDLYPEVLEQEGLLAALESLAEEGPLEFGFEALDGRLGPETEIVMYLTLREVVEGLAARCGSEDAQVAVTVGDGRAFRGGSERRQARRRSRPGLALGHP